MMPVGTQWGPPMTSGTFSLFKAGFSRKPCLSTGGSPDIFWSHKPPPLEQSPSHPFIRETPPFVTKPMGFLVVGSFPHSIGIMVNGGGFCMNGGMGWMGWVSNFPGWWWLVAINFIFPEIVGFFLIIPIDFHSYFSEGWPFKHQPDQPVPISRAFRLPRISGESSLWCVSAWNDHGLGSPGPQWPWEFHGESPPMVFGEDRPPFHGCIGMINQWMIWGHNHNLLRQTDKAFIGFYRML